MKTLLSLVLAFMGLVSARGAMFQVPISGGSGGSGGALTNGYSFNGPFNTVNVTNIYIHAAISNLVGAPAITNRAVVLTNNQTTAVTIGNDLTASNFTAVSILDSGDLTVQGSTIGFPNAAFTANRALYLDIAKHVATSAGVTSTELEYLDGVTSSIQTQLDTLATGAWTADKNAGGFSLTNAANVTPGTSNLTDIGSLILPFRNAYFASNVNAQTVVLSATTAGELSLRATNTLPYVMRAANSNAFAVTNLVGLIHKANAVYQAMDCNFGNEFQITNRIAQNTVVDWQNMAQGQEVSLRVSGAASGGTDYYITNVFPATWLVADQSTNAANIDTKLTMFVGAGKGVELNIKAYKLLSNTNVAGAVYSTYKE